MKPAVNPEPADAEEDADAEQRDAVIERIAREVVGRRMETPAILFLEMHKPLSFVASQGVLVGAPVFAPFFGIKNVEVASRLMANRGNVELLIRRIEELAAERK